MHIFKSLLAKTPHVVIPSSSSASWPVASLPISRRDNTLRYHDLHHVQQDGLSILCIKQYLWISISVRDDDGVRSCAYAVVVIRNCDDMSSQEDTSRFVSAIQW